MSSAALSKEALRESLCESGSLGSTVATAASAAAGGACTAVNTEWGAFRSAAVPRCDADEAMDAASFRPGKQLLEKAVAGYYLGEVARRCAFGPVTQCLGFLCRGAHIWSLFAGGLGKAALCRDWPTQQLVLFPRPARRMPTARK